MHGGPHGIAGPSMADSAGDFLPPQADVLDLFLTSHHSIRVGDCGTDVPGHKAVVPRQSHPVALPCSWRISASAHHPADAA
jgi:hypothetical protein